MKTFKIITTLLLAGFLFPFHVQSHNIPPVTDGVDAFYCNPRFNFCIEYPADVFVEKETPANADGIFLSTEDNMMTMAVYGELNVFNYDIKDQFEFLLASLKDTDGTVLNHLTLYGEGGESVSSQIEFANHVIELRCKIIDNHFVTIITRIKNKDKTRFEDIEAKIKVRITS